MFIYIFLIDSIDSWKKNGITMKTLYREKQHCLVINLIFLEKYNYLFSKYSPIIDPIC